MKKLAAIAIGLFSAYIVIGIVGKLFGSVDGRMSVQMPVNVVLLFVGGPIGAWWVLRDAVSWRRLVFNGCRLGAIEWLVTIVSCSIYKHRVPSSLMSSGLTQRELMGQGMTASVSAGLDVMIAWFGAGVCVVGLLLTRSPRRVPATSSPRVSRVANSSPNPVITGCIVVAEVVVAALLLAFLAWCRSANLGLEGILAAFVMVAGMGLLVLLAIAGLAQGLRLLKSRPHRTLGVAAVAVSAIPILFAGFHMAKSAVELRQLDARNAERRKQYQEVEPFFQSPQALQNSYAAGDEVVFVFAGGLEARMVTSDSEGLSRFCNELLVGKKLDVLIPKEEQFLRNPSVNVLYERTNLEKYWKEKMQADQYGQWKVDRAAMLAARRSALPAAPDSGEVARIAKQLRPFADSNTSGLLDDQEGRSFCKLIEFGLEASYLTGRGFDRSRIARSTGVASENLDEQAREYRLMADRIEEAGIVNLPVLTLPAE